MRQWHRKVHRNGQSTLEGVVGLLIFATFFALVLQVIWILLAQQIMQAATLQAARVGSSASMNLLPMRVLIFERLKIIPGIQLHIPKIERILPTDESIAALGVYDEERKRFKLEVDFPYVRMQGLTKEQQENYLTAQVLQIEITYCFPLRVPVAASIIMLSVQNNIAALYCQAQAQGSYAVLPIETTATVPLAAALWQN